MIFNFKLFETQASILIKISNNKHILLKHNFLKKLIYLKIH
jgi:hypothetical protein